MIKLLFLSYRDFETVDGFTRELEFPRKYAGNPIMVSDDPAEGNTMSFYGSVIRRPDTKLWQMWYTVRHPKIGLALAYAESEDGIVWRRPALDVVKLGRRKTHLVMQNSPHGAAVFYDEREDRPAWRYKLITGIAPSNCISVFHSGDGIHWLPAAPGPVIGTNPDCPIGFFRDREGRYVAYHRKNLGDRRVARSESWDFRHWTEPKIVLEPTPRDPVQTQFYGMGAIPYGAYEIGTLWIYRTYENDMGFHKMHGHQEPELAFTRTGYAWHRAAEGQPWIPRGKRGSWDWGMVQPASAPVFLEDEIRFYYAGIRVEHGYAKEDVTVPRAGIGFATMKPDRFVSLTTSSREGMILTRPFWTETPQFFVNAAIRRDGEIRVEVTDTDARPIPGFSLHESLPIYGDSISHRLAWRGNPDPSKLANLQIRLRVKAKNAKLYALFSGTDQEIGRYWEFRIPHFRPMEIEKKTL